MTMEQTRRPTGKIPRCSDFMAHVVRQCPGGIVPAAAVAGSCPGGIMFDDVFVFVWGARTWRR
jgi:hypothetical protein